MADHVPLSVKGKLLFWSMQLLCNKINSWRLRRIINLASPLQLNEICEVSN